MEVIRDTFGNVIHRSKNLSGIRRYVGGSHPRLIKILAINRVGDDEGKLCILFEDRSSFETNFFSFDCVKRMVRNWRNVYGARLVVNGVDAGEVGYRNPALV